MMVPKRAGDDFRRGRGPLVDQHHHGNPAGQIAFRRAIVLLVMPLAGGDDPPSVKENVGHFNRLVEQTARVVPQIQDEPAHPLADRLFERHHRRRHLFADAFRKAGDPQISDIALGPPAHGGDIDDRPRDRNVERFVFAASD